MLTKFKSCFGTGCLQQRFDYGELKMDRLLINGGHRLEGELAVHSAKTACLPCLRRVFGYASRNAVQLPQITDIINMTKIIEALGGKIFWEKDDLTVDCSVLTGNEIPSSYAKEIRSSLFLMGPIIGRLKHAKAVFPGGCDIGIRPIDLHLKGLRALNIDIEETGGFCIATEKMREETIFILIFQAWEQRKI